VLIKSLVFARDVKLMEKKTLFFVKIADRLCGRFSMCKQKNVNALCNCLLVFFAFIRFDSDDGTAE